MKNFKKFLLRFLCCSFLLCSAKVAFAASSSYSSSYDMTGGVFSGRSFDVNSYITTSISPKQGTVDVDMHIYKAEKAWYGDYVATDEIGTVSSTAGGSVTCYDTGTYKIYLRNYTGFQWYGNVSFRWE